MPTTAVGVDVGLPDSLMEEVTVATGDEVVLEKLLLLLPIPALLELDADTLLWVEVGNDVDSWLEPESTGDGGGVELRTI
jgi:hypothetical protein